jgi:hypothetical protein
MAAAQKDVTFFFPLNDKCHSSPTYSRCKILLKDISTAIEIISAVHNQEYFTHDYT